MIRRPYLTLLLVCGSLYLLMSYGGLRAPDEEVVYRVAENFAAGRGLGVSSDLEAWKGFGTVRGKDSVIYSVYPPLQSVILVPFIWVDHAFQWAWTDVPLSHYVERSLFKILNGESETNVRPHTARFIASFAGLGITIGLVLVYYSLLYAVTGSVPSSLWTSMLLGLGTIFWNYAGTTFSEPLAVLLLTGGLYGLVRMDPAFQAKRVSLTGWLWSGTVVGLAVTAHTLTVVTIPFLLWYAIKLSSKQRRAWLTWLAGLSLGLALLAWFNWVRFDHILESGRNLSVYNKIVWVSPGTTLFWKNLFGLMLGSGKGLLLCCPAALVGALTWKYFRKHESPLRTAIAMIVMTVIVVVASYKDWHAGFCLGPRYLLMIVPLLLIPVAFWINSVPGRQRLFLGTGLFVMLFCQQLYFNIGDIFTYDHLVRLTNLAQGIDIFIDDRFYLDWKLSPLLYLLDYHRGPFLLKPVDFSNYAIWAGLSLGLGSLVGWMSWRILSSTPVVPNKNSRR